MLIPRVKDEEGHRPNRRLLSTLRKILPLPVVPEWSNQLASDGEGYF